MTPLSSSALGRSLVGLAICSANPCLDLVSASTQRFQSAMPPVAMDTKDLAGSEAEEENQAADFSKPLPQKTVIFFDWDDTLLCSSFLSGEGFRLDTETEKTEEMAKQLKDLEQSVISVVKLAMTYGEVHIVTNAETGWVQRSAQKFIPGVVPLLSKVAVLSARSTYEGIFPESPLKWKFYAFQERLSKTFELEGCMKNILSFGDSHVEREAVRAVTRNRAHTRTKSVKFAERPSIEQLQRQIELVTNCFQYIFNHEGDLDLCMSLSVTRPEGAPEQNPQQQQQQPQQVPARPVAVAE